MSVRKRKTRRKMEKRGREGGEKEDLWQNTSCFPPQVPGTDGEYERDELWEETGRRRGQRRAQAPGQKRGRRGKGGEHTSTAAEARRQTVHMTRTAGLGVLMTPTQPRARVKANSTNRTTMFCKGNERILLAACGIATVYDLLPLTALEKKERMVTR